MSLTIRASENMQNQKLILASSSAIRKQLLTNAGISFESIKPNIDEQEVKISLIAQNYFARDIADALAEAKAQKISKKFPERLVLGSDQTLEFQGIIFDKPQSEAELIDRLLSFNNNVHRLYSAVVFYQNGKPITRFVDKIEIKFYNNSSQFIQNFVKNNWKTVKNSCSGYYFEDNGVQLIESYRGDYYSLLGLPILFVIRTLREKGLLDQ